MDPIQPNGQMTGMASDGRSNFKPPTISTVSTYSAENTNGISDDDQTDSSTPDFDAANQSSEGVASTESLNGVSVTLYEDDIIQDSAMDVLKSGYIEVIAPDDSDIIDYEIRLVRVK